MVQEMLLNVVLCMFLFVCLMEHTLQSKKLTLKELRKKINTIPLSRITILFLFPIAIVVLLLITGHKNIISLYIYTSLSLLILLHAWWLSQRIKYRKVLSLCALFVIFLRIFYPTILIHDIFVSLAIVWLGAAFTMFHFFTRKIFILVNCIWFVYDIVYVWITSAYQGVSIITQTTGFSLSLTVGHASIGLADLFYASLLIALIRHARYKILSIVVLLFSNALLGIYALSTQFMSVFPLLVLWVPCGISIMLLDAVWE